MAALFLQMVPDVQLVWCGDGELDTCGSLLGDLTGCTSGFEPTLDIMALGRFVLSRKGYLYYPGYGLGKPVVATAAVGTRASSGWRAAHTVGDPQAAAGRAASGRTARSPIYGASRQATGATATQEAMVKRIDSYI